MLELTAAAVIIGAFLLARDREHNRTDVTTRALLDRIVQSDAAHLTATRTLLADHRHEVQILCQRLQAPEQAVVEHLQANAPDEPAYPLTDSETIEAQDARARFIAEIERLEAEGLPL